MKKVIYIFSLFLIILIVNTGLVNASNDNFTVYTNNCPGGEDWKHEFHKKDLSSGKMARQVTGWVKKDVNEITISFVESVSGSVSYSASFSNSIKVKAKLMDAAIGGTNEISNSILYSYTCSNSNSYTWVISPYEKGNYFCVGVNYKTIRYSVDHYKQKFKLFGQGKYIYKTTSQIEVPTDTYLCKNYRYEIDGVTYEA